MKKLLLTTSIVALSLCGAFAGDGKSFKEVKTVVTPEPTCLFRDMEFQVDGFYSGWIGSGGSRFHTGSGGGFGLNFFFAKYFGIGYEAQWYRQRRNRRASPGRRKLLPPLSNLRLEPRPLRLGGRWRCVGWRGPRIWKCRNRSRISLYRATSASSRTGATSTAARILATLPTFARECGLRSSLAQHLTKQELPALAETPKEKSFGALLLGTRRSAVPVGLGIEAPSNSSCQTSEAL